MKKIVFVSLSLLFSCSTVSNSPHVYKELPDVDNVDAALKWADKNLYYKNDDPWDTASNIGSILKNGYGDCKMLAGVVSALLDKVGQKNLFVVIKDEQNGEWHMFNVFRNNRGWRVVDNLKLNPRSFKNVDDIKKLYKVDEFIKVFEHYEDFRKWFNEEVYPKG
ncbi:MAG: hypothetical protein V1647_00330 [Pseudomonadota bacterium]